MCPSPVALVPSHRARRHYQYAGRGKIAHLDQNSSSLEHPHIIHPRTADRSRNPEPDRFRRSTLSPLQSEPLQSDLFLSDRFNKNDPQAVRSAEHFWPEPPGVSVYGPQFRFGLHPCFKPLLLSDYKL